MIDVDWNSAPLGATHFLPAKDDLHHDIFLIIEDGIVLKVGYPGELEYRFSYLPENQPIIDLRRAIARHEAVDAAEVKALRAKVEELQSENKKLKDENEKLLDCLKLIDAQLAI